MPTQSHEYVPPQDPRLEMLFDGLMAGLLKGVALGVLFLILASWLGILKVQVIPAPDNKLAITTNTISYPSTLAYVSTKCTILDFRRFGLIENCTITKR